MNICIYMYIKRKEKRERKERKKERKRRYWEYQHKKKIEDNLDYALVSSSAAAFLLRLLLLVLFECRSHLRVFHYDEASWPLIASTSSTKKSVFSSEEKIAIMGRHLSNKVRCTFVSILCTWNKYKEKTRFIWIHMGNITFFFPSSLVWFIVIIRDCTYCVD